MVTDFSGEARLICSGWLGDLLYLLQCVWLVWLGPPRLPSGGHRYKPSHLFSIASYCILSLNRQETKMIWHWHQKLIPMHSKVVRGWEHPAYIVREMLSHCPGWGGWFGLLKGVDSSSFVLQICSQSLTQRSPQLMFLGAWYHNVVHAPEELGWPKGFWYPSAARMTMNQGRHF